MDKTFYENFLLPVFRDGIYIKDEYYILTWVFKQRGGWGV